jgi:hypothetical protein
VIFGRFREGFRPLRPYRWKLDEQSLLEMPVTTMPVFKVPIHVSYLLYLSVFAPPLARLYFRTAVGLCRLTRTPMSLLLHPTDFLGCDDTPDMAFFPAMNLPSGRKVEMVRGFLRVLVSRFRVVSMLEHAQEADRLAGLAMVQPQFC